MDNFLIYIESILSGKEILALPLVFVGGILLACTPCSLPMIPIMLSIAGANERASRLRAVAISAVFVLGMVLAYMTLGFAASLMGIFFNTVAESIWFRGGMAGVLILMGLITLEVIPVSFSLVHVSAPGHHGLGSAFFLGAVGGFASTGCVLPVLGAVLMMIAGKKDAGYGAAALACFALGMGSVYFVCTLLGREAFSRISHHPRVLVLVKKLLGVIILLFAGHLVYSLFT
jgi:cytochrome c biogenesis protein CcdA